MPVCDRVSGKRGPRRRRTLMVGAAMMAAMIVWGCTVKKPQVPRITIPFHIAVADEMTTIRQVAEENASNSVDGYLQIPEMREWEKEQERLRGEEGEDFDEAAYEIERLRRESLSVDFSAEFGDEYPVGEDRLAVEPNPAEFFTELGPITLEGQDLEPNTVRLGDVLPQTVLDAIDLAAAAGKTPTADLDPLEFGRPDLPLMLPNVTSLTVFEGGLEVQIENGFPVDLARVEIGLYDEGNDRSVDSIVFGTIAVGETSERNTLEFNPQGNETGNQISGELSLTVTGSTAAGENVTIDPDAVLSIDTDLLQLTVFEAVALIPQQEFTDTQVLTFPDSRIRVTSATISEGSITLVVTNEIPVIMSVSLKLPDLVDAAGDTARFDIDELSTGVPTVIEFPLAGHVFEPEDPDAIRLVYSAETFPSDTEVKIARENKIDIVAEPERLAFSNVTGILDNLTLPIDPVTRSVNFPEGLDNLRLDQTFLSVVLTSAVGVKSFMDLVITGVNSFGEASPKLRIKMDFEAASPGNEQTFALDVDPTAFLNSLPTEITVTPTVRIGDGENEDFIEPEHWVRIDSVSFRAPARFTIADTTQIQPDPQFREFSDEEYREKISDNLIRSWVVTKINNHLPLGVSVSLRAALDSADVYNVDLDSVLEIGPFEVRAAPVDHNGQVLDDEVQAFVDTLQVTKDEALFFLQEGGVWTGVLIQLAGTGGGPVELRGDDYISVVAGAGLEIEINDSLMK